MAAYASSVTLYTPKCERISRNLGIVAGRINITNYNSTTTEETTITRLFKASGVAAIAKGIISLQIVSAENGYLWGFIKSTGKFKLFQAPVQTHGHDFTIVKGAIVMSTELGLSADATSATVNNNTIAATRILAKATGPVVSETLAAAGLSELATDVDAGEADFVAIGFIAA